MCAYARIEMKYNNKNKYQRKTIETVQSNIHTYSFMLHSLLTLVAPVSLACALFFSFSAFSVWVSCVPLSGLECNALIFIFILKHKIYFHVLLHLLSIARARQPFLFSCVCMCVLILTKHVIFAYIDAWYFFLPTTPFFVSLISSHPAFIHFCWFIRVVFFSLFFFHHFFFHLLCVFVLVAFFE